MNLLDLFIRITAKDEASPQIESLSTSAIAKAQVIASAVTNAAQSAYNSISSFLTNSVNAYATFEQQIGGMETFFGAASDTVIKNAKSAYQTAGMSANQYMTNVSTFATTLINSVAKRRQQVLTQDTTAQQKALDTQVSNLQKALSKQYSAQQKAYSKAYSARSDALSDELDELRDSLSKSVDARQKALDQEVKAFQKATDERIKEINREYKEKLKLVDEEEYERLKAIDDQIDALDAQAEAEQKAQKKREQQQKIADLSYKAANAKFLEDRAKAQQELADTLADIEQDERDEARKAQKDALRKQREAIKDEYSKRKEQIREQQSDELDTYKEARSAELEALQEHNRAQIEEIREANEKILKERQRANREELEAMRDAQDAQLEALKDSQDAQLAALRESVDNQKRALQEAASANSEYIEVTAEDQEEAARIADMAMRDMSDNANKMGTSMELLQNAYRGMSMQNFTMLDNLHLGYSGTRAEMERLLQDAEKIKAKNGEMVYYSIDSFADMVEAIHVVQEELGITGTTAEEGAKTIEGSLMRSRAAWENWIISLADPEWDVAETTKALVESVATSAGLIIPRVGEILSTLIETVREYGPQIWDQFKETMINAIPEDLREKWGGRIQGAIDRITQIAEDFGPIIDGAAALGQAIVDLGKFIAPLVDKFGKLIPVLAGAKLGFMAVAGIAAILGGPFSIVVSIIGVVVGALAGLLLSNERVRDGVISAWNAVVKFFQGIPNAIGNVFKNAGNWLVNAGKNIINGLWNGLKSSWSGVANWVGGLGKWIGEHKGPEAYDKALLVPNGKWIMGGLYKGLESGFERDVVPYVSDMGDSMERAFGNPTLSPYAASMKSGMSAMGAYQQSQSKQMTVILELDRVQLGRVVYNLNNEESQRVGVNLAGGFA